jgi:hypothetical protein
MICLWRAKLLLWLYDYFCVCTILLDETSLITMIGPDALDRLFIVVTTYYPKVAFERPSHPFFHSPCDQSSSPRLSRVLICTPSIGKDRILLVHLIRLVVLRDSEETR